MNLLTRIFLFLSLLLAVPCLNAQNWSTHIAPGFRSTNAIFPLAEGRVSIIGGNDTNDAIKTLSISSDSVGKLETNLFVSMLRAEIAKGYLVRYGFPAEDIEVLGHGPTKPVSSNDTREGRAENRRVNVTITMKDMP